MVGMHAQQITIRNQTNLQPVQDALISAGATVVFTDARGNASIAGWSDNQQISITCIGYETRTTTVADAKQAGTIYLVPTLYDLGGVTVSANKWEQKREEVPAHIITINRDEIAFNNPQTSADLLAQSGQVFVQKSQFGGGSPMIRGFATNRLLMVVDGVRMNTAIFRSGNIQNIISIDPNALDGVEVVLGPGSLIYGSDALGGVMDFHTLATQYSVTDKPLIKAQVMGRFSSANIEKTGHADLRLGWKKWASVTSVTFSDFDNLRMGSNGPDSYLRNTYVETINGVDTSITNDDPQVQIGTDMQYMNVMQKIEFKPVQHFKIGYTFNYSTTSAYDRYDRLIEFRDGLPRSAVWYYGPQSWQFHALKLHATKKTAFYDVAKATFGYQFFEESRIDRSYQKTTERTRTEQVNAYSANLDLQKAWQRKTVYYGLEGIVNGITSTGTDKDITTDAIVPGPTRYPDGSTWASYAAYASLHIPIGDRTHVQGGLRYNLVTIDATFDTTFYPFPFTDVSISNGALTGNLGITHQLTKSTQLNLNLSTGFRSPNIDDIGKVFDSEPGAVTIPNPDLTPEYAYNVDLGIIQQIGNTAEIQVTGFYTYLQNAIVRRTYQLNGEDSILYDGELSQVMALQNIDNAYVMGIEAALRMNITKNIALVSFLTFTKGEEQAEETGDAFVPLRHAPPMFGSTSVSYQTRKFRTELSADYNAEVPFEELAPSEADKPHLYAVDENGNPYCPGWFTLNLTAGYQISKLMHVQLAADNLLDVRYRPYSSGIVAPGRNLMATIRFSI